MSKELLIEQLDEAITEFRKQATSPRYACSSEREPLTITFEEWSDQVEQACRVLIESDLEIEKVFFYGDHMGFRLPDQTYINIICSQFEFFIYNKVLYYEREYIRHGLADLPDILVILKREYEAIKTAVMTRRADARQKYQERVDNLQTIHADFAAIPEDLKKHFEAYMTYMRLPPVSDDQRGFNQFAGIVTGGGYVPTDIPRRGGSDVEWKDPFK